MLKLCSFIFSVIIFSLAANSQEDLPTDYLDKQFHAGRRAALRELMPANSVFIILAYPTRTYSNDVDYLYHANPDMYYFTGYKEPHSFLLVFKEMQKSPEGEMYNEVLFVQPRNARAEQWTGKRLGIEGAREKLGIQAAFNGSEFKNFKTDFSKFDKIILDKFPVDVPRDPRDHNELSDLIELLKTRAGIPDDFTNSVKWDSRLYRELTGRLREIKTPEEMELIRKAVEISCRAQNEVMMAIHPDMSELEIQGLHEFVHKKYGAESVGYGSIIGAGENGCILHYMENIKTKVGSNLILMDVGAEYHGYTADVTRTIPANGKFTEEQKLIYNLVYNAQEAAFSLLKDGADWGSAGVAARQVIAEGLFNLGIIKNQKDVSTYYPHGLSHHIGLDVHDRGFSRGLKKDMVITIEPGIYIPPGSDCDKKWWGIAVRIEDDVLITENGYELLSHFAPRQPEEIEKMIAENSALDDFKLPRLKSAEKKAF